MRTDRRLWVSLVGLTLCMASLPAAAYIGPGAGVSFIGSLFSTLWVLMLAIFTVLFWPLRYGYKRCLRLIREKRAGEPELDSAEATPSAED